MTFAAGLLVYRRGRFVRAVVVGQPRCTRKEASPLDIGRSDHTDKTGQSISAVSGNMRSDVGDAWSSAHSMELGGSLMRTVNAVLAVRTHGKGHDGADRHEWYRTPCAMHSQFGGRGQRVGGTRDAVCQGDENGIEAKALHRGMDRQELHRGKRDA